ncbi:MAG: DUF1810 domain-containing protein [Bacteroidales bacterium]|nr:DUF1810 domain-containing protein [Bacteroidales bacterium]
MQVNFDLERFRKAHNGEGELPGYTVAMQEIRNGKKESNWMWYIFPQLRGLGTSNTAMKYGIVGKAEAKAFLADRVLGSHLREITNNLCQVRGKSAADIFGPDAKKLRSSLTLFYVVSGKEECFRKAMAKFFDEKLDPKTMELL